MLLNVAFSPQDFLEPSAGRIDGRADRGDRRDPLVGLRCDGLGRRPRVIGLVAERMLTPEARTRVAAILALEPGATLASVSSWADLTRDRSTAAWHFVQHAAGIGLPLPAPSRCPGANCVVGAVTTQVRRLASSTGQDQLEALKYVVHLVGDVHQPLHAGFADDRGGNSYQLQAFGMGTNLHAVWDNALVRPSTPARARSRRPWYPPAHPSRR